MRNVPNKTNQRSIPQANMTKQRCFSRIQPAPSQFQYRPAISKPLTATTTEHHSKLPQKVCGTQPPQVDGFTPHENERQFSLTVLLTFVTYVLREQLATHPELKVFTITCKPV